MAQAHAQWLHELFAELGDKPALFEQLGQLRRHLNAPMANTAAIPEPTPPHL